MDEDEFLTDLNGDPVPSRGNMVLVEDRDTQTIYQRPLIRVIQRSDSTFEGMVELHPGELIYVLIG